MKTIDYDYYLPEELIAQTPIEKRDNSRLMVVDRKDKTIENKYFYDITKYISPGDTIVLNNTRVLPARIFGTKENTGGKIELLLLKRIEEKKWEALVKPGKKAKPGAVFNFGNELKGTVLELKEDGIRVFEFKYDGVFEEILDKIGIMPLPPYIKESLEDKDRYQTVYSQINGSAAAPTAGLHFTEELLESLKEKGVNITYVTLHVGLGTFRPVKVENIESHIMHKEYYQITQETADIINSTKEKGNKVIAVGTTCVRTLESAAMDSDGEIRGSSGWTDIFIYPGFEFKAVDMLITNFHLPQSTLLMLISAFAEKELIFKAYKEAVEENYRFFSFGDAMLIK